MQVFMLVNYAGIGEGKVVEIVQAGNDWVKTRRGVYIQKEWVRSLGGSAIGKEVVI